MNFKQIQQLIKFVSKTDVAEVNIENNNFKINIKGPKSKPVDSTPQVVQPIIQAPTQVAQPVSVPQDLPKPEPVTESVSNENLDIRSSEPEEFLTVYPNPFKHEVSINSPIDEHIKIHSVTGLLINSFFIQKGKSIIDLTYLCEGVYFLQSDHFGQTIKIIKQ